MADKIEKAINIVEDYDEIKSEADEDEEKKRLISTYEHSSC